MKFKTHPLSLRTTFGVCLGVLGQFFSIGYAQVGEKGAVIRAGELSPSLIFENKMDFITETGTVTASSDGLGIPGVNVLIKGSLTGTVTDIDGYYTVYVPDNDETFVFASIGYITQEVPVNGRSTIDIVL